MRTILQAQLMLILIQAYTVLFYSITSTGTMVKYFFITILVQFGCDFATFALLFFLLYFTLPEPRLN